MIIDRHGRIAGKVSLIDIAIAAVLIGWIIGFGYPRISAPEVQVFSPSSDTKLYVTLLVEPIRQFSLDAINEGDIFYKQHDQLPMGTIVALRHEQAKAVIRYPDGKSENIPMEEKYSLYITLECIGSLTDDGYFLNDSQLVAVGNNLTIQSNMVVCRARIENISSS